jgi:thiamine biosynthesis lipoprotein
MQQTRILMGMPITVEIADSGANEKAFEKVFDYFRRVEDKFSPFIASSEISRINRGELNMDQYSYEMCAILALSEQTKNETNGYFDIKRPDGVVDPSGIVKGRTIWQTSIILKNIGFENFYIDAGGDVQVFGKNQSNQPWSIGIKNPFNQTEIVKILKPKDEGVATSGSYIRGQHIYNPHKKDEKLEEVVSLSVVGPNVYEADRFATAAFAMGRDGIMFIEKMPGLEAYMIDKEGVGTQTSGFDKYLDA